MLFNFRITTTTFRSAKSILNSPVQYHACGEKWTEKNCFYFFFLFFFCSHRCFAPLELFFIELFFTVPTKKNTRACMALILGKPIYCYVPVKISRLFFCFFGPEKEVRKQKCFELNRRVCYTSMRELLGKFLSTFWTKTMLFVLNRKFQSFNGKSQKFTSGSIIDRSQKNRGYDFLFRFLPFFSFITNLLRFSGNKVSARLLCCEAIDVRLLCLLFVTFFFFSRFS